MRKIISIYVLSLLLAGVMVGQSLPDLDLPAAPSTGVLDEGEVLGRGSDAERSVERLIETLARERGYRVFMVIERLLISGNAKELAAQLQKAWLPDGGGLVIVYESDAQLVGIGQNLESGEGITEGEVGIPAYEVSRFIKVALENALKKKEEREEAFVEALVAEVCKEIEAYFVRREAPVDAGRSLRLALVIVGALSLLALCWMGLSWLMGRESRRQTVTNFFPEIDVPERLGAPYGGGGGGSGSFGRGQK